MEQIGNTVLQFFGGFILPLMLPIFLLALLMGMRRPEHLLEEVFGLIEVVLGIFVALLFGVMKTMFKLMGSAFQQKGKSDSGGYNGGGKYPDDWKKRHPGPTPRAERFTDRV